MKQKFLILILLFPMLMNAQKQFTLDNVTPGGKSHKRFIPKDLEQMQWCGDTLVFVRENAIVAFDAASQTEKIVLTLDEMKGSSKKFPQFWANFPEICFVVKNRILIYNIEKKKFSEFDKWKNKHKNFDFCMKNKYFAFTEENDLFVNKLKINENSEENVVYGQAVHRNEFGITKGTFWSPKGNFLAFYRMDESMVADYEMPDTRKRKPKSQPIKYPQAGEKSHQVTIGIYDVKNRRTSFLKTDKPFDHYFTNLAWNNDETELYVAELNRRQDSCTLKAYDIQSGKARALFTETAPTYVEPENPPYFIDNEHFIWQSERTGHNHLYLYNSDGKLLRPLTQGDWDVLSVDGFDKKNGTLIFTSTEASVLERNIYSLEIENGKRQKISSEGGQHQAIVSPSGRYVVDCFSATKVPRKINLISFDKNLTYNLLTAENPYQKYAMPEMRFGTLKATDGSTILHYRLALPPNFDPQRKYPAIVHVYGGAHVQMAQNVWLGGSKGWELYMAQRGFVLFTLDNRGSANRGQAFEEVLHRNIGKAPLDDQVRGVKFLKSRSYIDNKRIGVYGWSFGGFMATQLMAKTQHFKVGAAGGAVMDWRLYEVMYGERYMQTPQENPDGYAENDLTNYARKLKGKFLLIHCELDPVVRFVNAEKFLFAAKMAGKEVEFIRYQKHGHNVQGRDRVKMFERISKFFEENLK